jgi:demethylmenaquinone methyltransferase/2-methoxy-6-polyprenyl-1,4-benzoquinol methylase
MFDAIANRYDLLNTVLSCGLHRVWEARLVRRLSSAQDERCLDLCTGTGALVPRLARQYREVVGVDISSGMLDVARKRWRDITNVSWREGDAQALDFEDQAFGVITVAYGVRNWPDFRVGLSEVYRVLKYGGQVGILEFGQPRSRIWRWVFGLYSRYVIPLVGGLISGSRAPYEYLPQTSAVFPCGDEFVGELRSIGFSAIQSVSLMGGVAYIYIAHKEK